MKTSVVILLSVMIGLALGVGSAVSQLARVRGQIGIDSLDNDAQSRLPKLPPSGGEQPVAEVDHAEYDFGVMQRAEKRTHDFRITNRGGYPLELRQGETSCKCTISRMENGLIPSGESATVTLQWQARSAMLSTAVFRETATILTNDPKRRRIVLTVVGRVIDTLQVEPKELVFGKVEPGKETTVSLKLLAYHDERLELIATKFSDEASSQFFQVTAEPLPPGELTDVNVKSGIAVTVTLKPGLPIGTFRQDLELTTNATSQGTLQIPIHGEIASDISIAGPGWNPERGVLFLGTVKSSEGAQRQLRIFVRGESPEQVEFVAVRADPPDTLRVSLGEKKIINDRVVSVPLLIDIPKGSKPINRLGTQQAEQGEVVIETTHPAAKSIRVFVRFAVEG